MIEEEFLNHVAHIIRTRRKRAGISAKAMARDMKISQSTLSRYETGKIDIGAKMMAQISKYIGFPIRHYFETFNDKEN